ncbi:Spherulation-specific family 4 [Tricladium varicosporioides]|nr:Spherulation-specific family 4 [Hymenoscyphus varicosporioides]
MSILLPLYVYPWPGVWDALYTTASTHPKVNFTVILNPCSGPCVNGTPEAPYLAEIPKLKLYPNIRTLGYVATNYTNKPIDRVIEEVKTYANWSSSLNDSRMAVDGVFFDEIPGLYHWQKYAYLGQAKDVVKSSAGLGQQVIVHNPGTVPDRVWNYLNLSDITVVYEEAFTNWLDRTTFDTLSNFQNVSSHPKSELAIMLHSLPNLTDGLLKCVVGQLEGMVDWFFVTNVAVKNEYWHSFSGLFKGLVGGVEGLANKLC